MEELKATHSINPKAYILYSVEAENIEKLKATHLINPKANASSTSLC